MEYDGSIKIDTALELSHLQQDIGSLDTILNGLLGSVAQFGLKFILSGITSASKFSLGIINGIASLPQRFISLGNGVVSGFWNGVHSMQSWLYGKVSSFFNGVISAAKRMLGINSPSRVFRDLIGVNMARGVYEGFSVQSHQTENGIAEKLLSMTQRLRTAAVNSASRPQIAYGTGSSTAYNSYDTRQVFNFNTPIVSPSQLARAARRASLVY